MDTTVTGIGGVVVAELRAARYMESTISNYEKTIRALAAFVKARDGIYSPKLGAEFASMTVSPRTGRFSVQRRFTFGRLVRVFDSYLRSGRVDLSVGRRGGGGPYPSASSFAVLNAAWELDMRRRCLAPATREAYGRVARAYLVFLEERGVNDLAGADGASVLAFLGSLVSGKWAKSWLFWVVSNFRSFLKFTDRADLVDALGLAGIKRPHEIIPALSDDDEELVVAACASGVVSAREAAITLLALTTRFRACDIVGLRKRDIDWRGRTIGVVQQKTGNPLRLPLPALLMTKLADYVLDERPTSADDHVFLRSKAPHTPLSSHAAVHRVTVTTFRTAGVANPKAGTRLLRHNAASRLMAAAVALPTISAVLGHASMESTNVYLSADWERLLECVLPVPEGARP